MYLGFIKRMQPYKDLILRVYKKARKINRGCAYLLDGIEPPGKRSQV